MFVTNDGTFIYNDYTCIEALEAKGFDVEEVKYYISEEDDLDARLKIMEEMYKDLEHYMDGLSSTLSETFDFLEDIERMLRKGRPTKEKIADQIARFLNSAD